MMSEILIARTTLYIDSDLLIWLKIHAAQEGCKVNDVIISQIEEYKEEVEIKEKHLRDYPHPEVETGNLTQKSV